MINVNVYSKEKCIQGFELSGHAGYSEYGNDVVCAAVSVLVINTINSIENFTDDLYDCSTDEQIGYISFKLTDDGGNDSQLLLKSMLLGLESMRDEYGSDYIKLVIEEV
ncbi:ribosomal-processing cysteine protease Prp [Vallitalea pronyensis]|uniref:Ribosomal processing cysteine protease Prp n=1 Tax=Vallitalea pronyensis TaxID=1348613 RepID=A0A8J8MKN5_9FIRM|nr:ribosomal-processing cysteine protease Prp [Vallitalea pronyensis]QUI23430.1 ribosomal-processing cysteine protease Prp [Vallitalea pronyensis]